MSNQHGPANGNQLPLEQSSLIDDTQWSALVGTLPLQAIARHDIQNVIKTYLETMPPVHTTPPHLLHHELQSAGTQLTKAIKILESFDVTTVMDLTEPVHFSPDEKTLRRSTMRLWEEEMQVIRRMIGRCENRAALIKAEIGGPRADHIDWMTEALLNVVAKYSKSPVKKSKRIGRFVEQVFHLADYRIETGQLEGTLKRSFPKLIKSHPESFAAARTRKK